MILSNELQAKANLTLDLAKQIARQAEARAEKQPIIWGETVVNAVHRSKPLAADQSSSENKPPQNYRLATYDISGVSHLLSLIKIFTPIFFFFFTSEQADLTVFRAGDSCDMTQNCTLLDSIFVLPLCISEIYNLFSLNAGFVKWMSAIASKQCNCNVSFINS